ncbi:hypothetical protein B0I35DRAFT_474818 [Stachybotrys elegans]|uniref:C2H2-type domain-containing protein n=1 Tax=Stachybotrys elegans TaxID=80388 RepID=A0A8K0WUY0_9HYPO|nr:hypothetical protein B0I35DRAFT_474818 [Stachybotrys elegans]
MNASGHRNDSPGFGLPHGGVLFGNQDVRRTLEQPNGLNPSQNAMTSTPYGISAFCRSGNEDPWVGLSLGDPNLNFTGSAPYMPNNLGFTAYRERNLPSDCDTVAGDSGYGTYNNPYSVASAPSVRDDDSTVDSQLTKPMAFLGTHSTISASVVNSNTSSKQHFCHTCNRALKTKSELNKHHQRHSKPHLCPYTSCRRSKEGFSTKNDLQRHRKSVHRELEGNGRVFVCREGSCMEKSKLWPRADNFRHHLDRVHHKKVGSDDDLSEFMHSPSPALRDTLKGVGSSVADIHHDSHVDNSSDGVDILPEKEFIGFTFQNEPMAPSFPNMMPQPVHSHQALRDDFSRQEILDADTTNSLAVKERIQHMYPRATNSFMRYNTTDEQLLIQHRPYLSAHSHAAIETQFAGLHPEKTSASMSVSEGTAITEARSRSSTVQIDGDTAQSQELTAESLTESDEDTSRLDIPLEPMSTSDSIIAEISSSLPHMSKSQLLQILKTIAKDPGSIDGRSPLPEVSDASKNRRPCPDCPKVFNRLCELKKHRKRHEKPYRCTFRGCMKEFGSKNDWKRHESSQHYNLETWHCEEAGCKKACQRRETFKSHLERDHKITDLPTIDRKVEKCRLGRHCDPRFWCGFCVKFIIIDEPTGNTWTKRCDHIDNHLFGKEGLEQKNSKDWQYEEDHIDKIDNPRTTPDCQAPTAANTSLPGLHDRRRKATSDLGPHSRKRATGDECYLWFCVSFSTSHHSQNALLTKENSMNAAA